MLTSLDLENMSLTMQKAGNAINERINNSLRSLDYDQLNELNNIAGNLFSKSRSLLAHSVIQLEDEAKNSLQALQNAQTQIEHTIKTLQDVQKVIDFSAQLVDVAAFIISGGLTSAVATAKSILDSLV